MPHAGPRGVTGVRQRPAVPRIRGNRGGWVAPGQHVILQQWSRKRAIVALIGKGGVKPVSGGSVWEEIERDAPKNAKWDSQATANISEHKGRHNKRLSVSIVLDGWIQQQSAPQRVRHAGLRPVPRITLYQEANIELLEQWWDEGRPLRIVGPVPRTHVRRKWGIDDIAYDDDPTVIRDRGRGRRIRQAMTLTLIELAAAQGAIQLPKKGKASPKSTESYLVRAGDDLWSIAAKTLAEPARWPEIAALNEGMRGTHLDARRYPPGSTITVPKQ